MVRLNVVSLRERVFGFVLGKVLMCPLTYVLLSSWAFWTSSDIWQTTPESELVQSQVERMVQGLELGETKEGRAIRVDLVYGVGSDVLCEQLEQIYPSDKCILVSSN